MGIISRFKDIMAANINALLDKCEDPEKMIDQYLRNLESDLGKVKAETASVMAEETRSKRALDECNAEIEKFQGYAVKAVQAGNDEDARQFLAKKNQLVEKQTALKQAYDLASANATKMRQMHDKLVKDINELNAKKDTIKAKIAVAKTQPSRSTRIWRPRSPSSWAWTMPSSILPASMPTAVSLRPCWARRMRLFPMS